MVCLIQDNLEKLDQSYAQQDRFSTFLKHYAVMAINLLIQENIGLKRSLPSPSKPSRLQAFGPVHPPLMFPSAKLQELDAVPCSKVPRKQGTPPLPQVDARIHSLQARKALEEAIVKTGL